MAGPRVGIRRNPARAAALENGGDPSRGWKAAGLLPDPRAPSRPQEERQPEERPLEEQPPIRKDVWRRTACALPDRAQRAATLELVQSWPPKDRPVVKIGPRSSPFNGNGQRRSSWTASPAEISIEQEATDAGEMATPMGDSCSSRTSPNRASPSGRCSLQDPERISATELSTDKEIGKGFTAKVFLGAFKTHQVAVKKMRDKDLAFNEAQIMAQLDHPCIVKLHGICETPTDTGLVLEYCSGGILFDILYVQDGEIAWSQQLKICSDVANAMSHLHCMDPKIVHRDLKSPNVLLGRPLQGVDDVPTAKVGDFGLSSFLDGEMAENVGTPHWMAPECFAGGNYDEKVDVYSFGILLFEIVFLEPPYEDMAVDGIKGFVGRGGRPKPVESVPSGCPYALGQLMEECWCQSPGRRPHFNNILMTLCQLEVDESFLASTSTARGRSRQCSKSSVVSVGMMF